LKKSSINPEDRKFKKDEEFLDLNSGDLFDNYMTNN
jgi:hypothetical protein